MAPVQPKKLRFKNNLYEASPDKKTNKSDSPESPPSIISFLNVELTRGYMLEHDEERFSARREKVYSFMKIPQELEKFMVYGFYQCADSLLFIYTFLPMRFLIALWLCFVRVIRKCFGSQLLYRQSILKPAETCDMLKGFILIVCSILMCYIDTNMMYHLVKSQSVMKLYIFYNMLEVGDRLFSAFGQDTIDALFWTATEPKDRKRQHLGLIPHLIFAFVYVFLHSLLVLFQATTINVAFNSNNKSLLIIMMSNNFIELKGSVFKKFDKNNLFQVSCSDVRERLHLCVLLFIVVLLTMKEYMWKEDRFWVLAPDCVLVLVFEVIIDWIKHAFITRFNDIPYGVFREYTISLAYDVAQTRQKFAFSDHSDLVARRMGFIPLPLGVVITRVIFHAVKIDGLPSVLLILLAYLCLFCVRVLVSIVILGKACDLITQHQAEKSEMHLTPKKESMDWSPKEVTKLEEIEKKKTPKKTECNENNIPPTELPAANVLGAAALFSNSAVDINGVCQLNDKVIKQEPPETVEAIVEVSRSEPDINAASNNAVATEDSIKAEMLPEDETTEAGRIKRRSESEPNLANIKDEECDQ